MRSTKLAMSLVAALAAVLPASPAGAAGASPDPASPAALPAAVLASSDSEIEVSAHEGRVAWWQFDPAVGGFGMFTALSGKPAEATAASRLATLPRGFDLGPDEDGTTVAVYSRCRDAIAQERCDIYRYDFASNLEKRVQGLTSNRFSETHPTIWRGSIAFARSGRKGNARFARVYVLRQGHLTHLEGGWYEFGVDDGPTGMDLRGERLAYVWRRYGAEIEYYELRVVPTGGGRGRTVQTVGHGGAGFNALVDPVLADERTLIWLDQGFDGKYDVRAFDLRSRDYRRADPLDPGACANQYREVTGMADGGPDDFAYVMQCADEVYSLLRAAGPSFTDAGATPPAKERSGKRPRTCEIGRRSLCRNRA